MARLLRKNRTRSGTSCTFCSTVVDLPLASLLLSARPIGPDRDEWYDDGNERVVCAREAMANRTRPSVPKPPSD
jgi:hypothetical protein